MCYQYLFSYVVFSVIILTHFLSSFSFFPLYTVSVSYMDMYLSKRKTDKQQLQLLAMVCIFVASKFHEVEPISIQELQTLAEGGYTEKSIRDLELDLLSTLNWEMNPITSTYKNQKKKFKTEKL